MLWHVVVAGAVGVLGLLSSSSSSSNSGSTNTNTCILYYIYLGTARPWGFCLDPQQASKQTMMMMMMMKLVWLLVPWMWEIPYLMRALKRNPSCSIVVNHSILNDIPSIWAWLIVPWKWREREVVYFMKWLIAPWWWEIWYVIKAVKETLIAALVWLIVPWGVGDLLSDVDLK